MVFAHVMVLTRDGWWRGSHGLSAWRVRRTKSRGPKGLQLEVGARRAPRLLVITIRAPVGANKDVWIFGRKVKAHMEVKVGDGYFPGSSWQILAFQNLNWNPILARKLNKKVQTYSNQDIWLTLRYIFIRHAKGGKCGKHALLLIWVFSTFC